MDDDTPRASSSAPECYVIVHNVAKKHNIGTLARSATAFNVAKVRCMCIQSTNKLLNFLKVICAQICLVGSRHYNTFGSHGSAAHVPLAYFANLDECCTWLRQDKGVGTVVMWYKFAAVPMKPQPHPPRNTSQ